MEDTNLVSLVERFGSEDKCRAYLAELRWPDGPECPRCGDFTTISRIRSRNQFECDACRYQFSVTAGTLLQDSHLPLWKWFLAVYLMCESKKGVSAKQFQRMLSVSYKTAWYLSRRIRAAMGDGERPLLTGSVEVDDTIVGGHGKGKVENPYLFRDTLFVLLHGDALPYTVLIERDDSGERQRENDALMRREAKRQARRPC